MINEEVFDSEYPALFGDLVALARALGAGGDAEDVAQEALLRARSRLHQLRDPHKLRAWVRRIAVRGACRVRQQQLGHLEQAAIERLPGTQIPNMDVALAVACLPERERLAVTLVFGMGYRQDEAAEMMGIAPGTVYSSIWRARRKLARSLAADERIQEFDGRIPR